MSDNERREFNFQDGTFSFEIDNVRFCVHRSIMTMHVPEWVAHVDQHGVDAAVDGLTPEDVEAVLSVIYPAKLNFVDVLTFEGWLSVLNFASQWHASPMQDMAMGKLSDGSINKLLTGDALNRPEMTHEALTELVLRPEPLTFDEAGKLSMWDVVLVSTMREDVLLKRCAMAVDAVSAKVEKALATGQRPKSETKKRASPAPKLQQAHTVKPQDEGDSLPGPDPRIERDAKCAALQFVKRMTENNPQGATTYITDLYFDHVSAAAVAWIFPDEMRMQRDLKELFDVMLFRCETDETFIPLAIKFWARIYAGTPHNETKITPKEYRSRLTYAQYCVKKLLMDYSEASLCSWSKGKPKPHNGPFKKTYSSPEEEQAALRRALITLRELSRADLIDIPSTDIPSIPSPP